MHMERVEVDAHTIYIPYALTVASELEWTSFTVLKLNSLFQ